VSMCLCICVSVRLCVCVCVFEFLLVISGLLQDARTSECQDAAVSVLLNIRVRVCVGRGVGGEGRRSHDAAKP